METYRRMSWFGPMVLALMTGCSMNRAKPKPDPYDQSKMNFTPTKAEVYKNGPKGPFISMALTPAPQMFPLDPSPVKEIRIDTTNAVINLAPGVKFSSWTFGNTVPGPTVRARVGDRIKFYMTNRSNELVGGMNMGAPMMHSLDFHSAMVSPQDKYRSIAPGETMTYEFTPNYPGVYMYHCGTPMILEHLGAGMYGMMVVEPKDGYPTKVDREYAIVQSEFYAMPDPLKRTVDGSPLFVLDTERLRKKDASHVVFNGRFNGMVERPLIAKVGERVRLFVLNAGPSGTSSFHVVGTIFDRVWMDGNPDNQMRGMQTVLLGASSGVIVEFTIPEKGKYIIVDHEFADAMSGAIGLIDATGEPPPVVAPDPSEHKDANGKVIPDTRTDAEKGQAFFSQWCTACHVSMPGAMRVAPDLKDVTKRHNDEWLSKWIFDPPAMLATGDPAAVKLVHEWHDTPMPKIIVLTPEIVQQVVDYLHQLDGTPMRRAGHGQR